MTTTPVASGTNSPGASVTSGNVLDVLNGGTATTTMVSSSGTLLVEVGGVETGATVSAGGIETIYGSGSNDVIFGSVVVSSSTSATVIGAVSNETVQNGGTLSLNIAGSVATNTLVNQGGALSISGRGVAINTALNNGSLSLLTAKATLSGTLALTGVDTLTFAAIASPLSAGSSFGDQATITGFAGGDIIDTTVLAGGTVSYAATAGGGFSATLAGTSAGKAVTQTYLFGADVTSANIAVMTDAAGTGTQLTYVACYCHGTNILTDVGEVAVEALRIGDLVVTVDGALEPIRWIGRRSYAGRVLAGRNHLQPIRIKAGALQHGVPKRDLLVSPLHAMLIDGVLVPAFALVNGATILREDAAQAVHYVHIELDQHGAIWAEGAASETFIDDEGRFLFQTTDGAAVAHTGPTAYCAPRVEQGFELDAIRRRIADRVAVLMA